MNTMTKLFNFAPATTVIFCMLLGVIATNAATTWVPNYIHNSIKELYTIKYTCYGVCTPSEEPSESVKELIDYDQLQASNSLRPFRM
jgi:hypothetical protein